MKVAQLCQALYNSVDCSPPSSSAQEILQARILEWGEKKKKKGYWGGYWGGLPFPSPGDLPNPGIEARSPALQADSLSAEPPGKPK